MTRTAQDIVQLAWDVLQRHSRSQGYYADARINIATLSCPFGGKEAFATRYSSARPTPPTS